LNSIEKSAKTVKEAIRLGLEELRCDSADVDIEVLEIGSPGIFGMFGKPARVRLTRKDAAKDDFKFDIPQMTLDAPSAPKGRRGEQRQPRKEKDKPEPQKPESSKVEQTREQAGEKKSKPRPRKEPKPAVEEKPQELFEEEPFVATPAESLTASAKLARDFIKELTEKMGAPVEMEIAETPEQLRVRMSGENMSMLIGRRGETLDSVQYLASLCVNRGREEYLRVSLDTENYRAKREEALRKLAVRMAARARKTGKRVALEPMNPYERRILHSALQNDPEVTTHSEGEEPYRRVIITLK
jgi:spoIIIJ-associated protein